MAFPTKKPKATIAIGIGGPPPLKGPDAPPDEPDPGDPAGGDEPDPTGGGASQTRPEWVDYGEESQNCQFCDYMDDSGNCQVLSMQVGPNDHCKAFSPKQQQQQAAPPQAAGGDQYGGVPGPEGAR